MLLEDGEVLRLAEHLGIIGLPASNRFKQVEEIVAVKFHIPDLDFLRTEITKSYIIGADHGCIMLCNMLLERYCKLVLIYKESGFKTIQDLDTIEERFRPLVKKYDKLNLSETLMKCRKEGILDEDAFLIFSKFKEIFRDAFFHANPSKTLKGRKGAFIMGNLDGSSTSAMKEITLQNVPPFASIAIKMFAEENSFGYMVSIENLIRKTIKHFINDVFDINLIVAKSSSQ
jgi:hypothetical protein